MYVKSGIATESAYYTGDGTKISLEVAEASQPGSAGDEKTRKRPNMRNCHLTVNLLSFRLITIYYFSVFQNWEIIMILNNKGSVDVSFLIDHIPCFMML